MNISLRNLAPEIEKAILETSQREGFSLNEATIRLLQASTTKPTVNRDFEEFSGSWSDADAGAFDAAIAEMRLIDAGWERAR